MTARRAAFLDRDGVLNERPAPGEYVTSLDEFRWIDGAADAVARLRSADYLVLVVSNQRGVARGLVTEDELRRIERDIQARLADEGASVAGFYYCPHEIDAGCDCRKPAPGLLTRAAADHAVALSSSVMIGDAESDVLAGRAAGCPTVRIGDEATRTLADLLVPDLATAARIVSEREPTA